MRAIYPAWDHLGPEPTLHQSIRIALVAAAIAATGSASVMFYHAGYSRRGMESSLTSPVAIDIKDPAAGAASTVIQDQREAEHPPTAVPTDDQSKPGNSISPADIARKKSTSFQFEQPLKDANRVARHRKTYWRHVFGRFGTPNHW